MATIININEVMSCAEQEKCLRKMVELANPAAQQLMNSRTRAIESRLDVLEFNSEHSSYLTAGLGLAALRMLKDGKTDQQTMENMVRALATAHIVNYLGKQAELDEDKIESFKHALEADGLTY